MTGYEVQDIIGKSIEDYLLVDGVNAQPLRTKELMEGRTYEPVSPAERIHTALRHLRYSLQLRDTRAAIIPFRKYYAGYLKGLHNSKEIRQELYQQIEYAPIEDIMLRYLDRIEKHAQIGNEN